MTTDNQIILKEKVFLKDNVEELLEDNNYSGALVILLRNQRLEWAALEKGYAQLQNIKTKTFRFEVFTIDAQFNPGRIKSTNADVSSEAIKKRKCFLCLENLPEEQEGINYNDEYLILCNPNPVFFEHFTITFNKHFPQRMDGSFETFLKLCKGLSKYYSVLYNGPRCGASAPDHLHFQAVNKNFLKIFGELNNLIKKYGEKIIDGRKKEAFGVNDGLRKFIVIKSKDKHFINKLFENLYSTLQKCLNIKTEPMMNILGYYSESSGWTVCIFLRKKHRPECYYKKGTEEMIISPAVIDLSGTLIVPREKDYEKLTKEKTAAIFDEVAIGKELFDYLKAHLKKIYLNINYF